MGFFDRFKGGSPLQAALKRGLAPGGNLVQELRDLDEYTIKSRPDALAIGEALRQFADQQVPPGKSHTSPLHAIVALFQEVEDAECDAFEVLQEEGIPLLAKVVRQNLRQLRTPGSATWPENDLLFALKVLGLYGTEEGADVILEAARVPLAPDDFLWTVILDAFQAGHPEAARVFNALADPLPHGFIAVALLDAANRFLLEDGDLRHPFDSEEGLSRLSQWLSGADPRHASYGVSATAALPFLHHPGRDALLTAALNHPDTSVALEAAWAAGKLGDERGIETLARCCLDVNRSTQARHYLHELDRDDAVPDAAFAPEFAARAEFAQWLAHPNELGRAPDRVDVIDHRQLRWPPEFQPKPFWLLRYHARATSDLEEDDNGIGLVGSITWSFFRQHLEQRPPEDAYALHCAWEMEHAKLLKFEEVDEDSTEYDACLAQWTGPAPARARIEHVAEISPELDLPRRLVAVANAELAGASGWLVLDGPASRWYAAAEMPGEDCGLTALKIHVGRQLLHLPEPEPGARAAWIHPAPQKPPALIVAAYEKLLNQLATLVAQPGASPSPSPSPGPAHDAAPIYEQLNRHFDDYLDALEATRGGSRESHLVPAYERLLDLARRGEDALAKDAYASFSALGECFDAYANALVAAQRHEDLRQLVAFFTPHWPHNRGYGQLGTAACKAGDPDTAERFFRQLREGLEDWHRCEEMGLLAGIWARRGQTAEAQTLLAECLQGVLNQSRSASGSDRQLYERWYQNHRKTLFELFPGQAPAILAQHQLPESTLRRH